MFVISYDILYVNANYVLIRGAPLVCFSLKVSIGSEVVKVTILDEVLQRCLADRYQGPVLLSIPIFVKYLMSDDDFSEVPRGWGLQDQVGSVQA